MTASPNSWSELKALFFELSDMLPAEREVRLRTVANADAALAADLRSLLAAHDVSDAQFNDVLPQSLGFLEARREAPTLVGREVGHYLVTRLVGRGGMGAIYEAHRADDEFRKRVAIKTIWRGAESDVVLHRFRTERQILASLQHPHIAALLDGGVTSDGLPYFVMEFVDGAGIDHYCASHRLGVADRVRLVREVCDAVQYAHQNLVVHRDIKPGNVLVTPDGVPKLLDFGIAKLIGTDGAGGHTLTEAGLRPFTITYASPEQLRGQAVSTATDVYSLGVLLFELLTGRPPFAASGGTSHELMREITEQDPPRLSGACDATAMSTYPDPSRVSRELTGDLDAIVQMALRKEPERRYQSAEQLSLDLRRYLEHQPVVAGPDTWSYRAAKFTRRHRTTVVAAGLLAVSLIGGTVATWRQARAAAQERDHAQAEARRADAERDKAQQVTAFLQRTLGSADPSQLGRDVTLREVLDSASVSLTSLASQPSVEGELRRVLGDTYFSLGLYDRAEQQLQRALEVQQGLHGPESREAALVQSALGGVAEARGDMAAAEQIQRAVLVTLRRAGPADAAVAAQLDNLSRVRQSLGDLTEAEQLQREALGIRRAIDSTSDDVAASLNNLAVVLGESGRLAPAESLHREALGITQRRHGPSHPLVANAMATLAAILDREGKSASADTLFRATLALRRTLLGAQHPDYAWTAFSYAQFLVDHQRFAEAIPLAREVLALRGQTLPNSHPAVAAALQALGRSLDATGQLADGGRALRESLSLRQAALPPGHWLIATSESLVGEHELRIGNLRAAEPLLVRAYRQLVATRGGSAPPTDAARARLIELYEREGRLQDAARLRGASKP